MDRYQANSSITTAARRYKIDDPMITSVRNTALRSDSTSDREGSAGNNHTAAPMDVAGQQRIDERFESGRGVPPRHTWIIFVSNRSAEMLAQDNQKQNGGEDESARQCAYSSHD
jgi:hypothetical protein